jgi:hypothetical protein
VLDKWNEAYKSREGGQNLLEVFSTVLSNFEGALLKLNKFKEIADRWTSLYHVHVLKINLANQTSSGWVALDL